MQQVVKHSSLCRQHGAVHFRIFRRATVLKATPLWCCLAPKCAIDLKRARSKELLGKCRHGLFLSIALYRRERFRCTGLTYNSTINIDTTHPTRNNTGIDTPQSHEQCNSINHVLVRIALSRGPVCCFVQCIVQDLHLIRRINDGVRTVVVNINSRVESSARAAHVIGIVTKCQRMLG